MTTEKQIDANRENAKKGGVKTNEGKAVSRLNALKHGLLSKEVLLLDEEDQDLEELGKRLRQQIKPVGEIEQLLTDRIIGNFWRLRRMLEVETATMDWIKVEQYTHSWTFEHGQDHGIRRGLKEMMTHDEIEKLLRYEAAIERGIYRALHELERLQSARAGNKPPLPVAIDLDIIGEKQNGFVS